MRSIRSRLTVLLLAGIGLLVVAAGFGLEVGIVEWLQREFDRALEAKAQALVTLTKQERGEVELDFADEFMPEFESPVDPYYFELWLDGTALLERSHSFQADPARRRAGLPRELALSAVPRLSDVVLPDGRAGRLIQVDFVPQIEDEEDVRTAEDEADPHTEPVRDPTTVRPGSGAHTATLLVARERETLDADLVALRWSFLAFTALLLGSLAALVALALKVGLRPLERLARQVHGLDAESLDRRVDVGSPPRELVAVVEQLNQLLGRLEDAFRHERRLTSDIAHELKTPIAELRSLCEVGARWPDDPEMVRKFFEDARTIGLQMERIVVHLLALARYDEGAESVCTEPVDLAAVVDSAWEPLSAEAGERDLELRNEISPRTVLDTDPDKLGLMVSNLLSNAVAYSRPGTPITCTFRSSDGRASLSFLSYPEDLGAADLPLIFERFWRKDEARTGGRNVGLGLTIVRAFADLLDFEIETGLDRDQLLRITLSRAS